MNAPPLQVFLFGLPRLVRKDEGVHIQRRKTLAMLAYLVLTGQHHSRDVLATLFWPDNDGDSSRANLRREIYWLNQALGANILSVDRQSVGIVDPASIWVDVIAFQEKLAFTRNHNHAGEDCLACYEALSEAVALYHGDFLAGFGLPDSPEFEEWQFFQSEQLRQSLGEALQKLVEWHARLAEFERGIEFARQWLAIDLLNEEAHRQLIRLYTWSGQQAAALRQYRECVRILDEELGLEPEPETTRIFEAARRRKLRPPQIEQKKKTFEDPVPVELASIPPASSQSIEIDVAYGFQSAREDMPVDHVSSGDAIASMTSFFLIPDLPSDPTPFIGRQKELGVLLEKLGQPNVRLITIVGLGGMGKTRLALEAARKAPEMYSERYSWGAVFVPFAGVSDANDFPIALARSLNIQLGGQLDPLEEIINILSEESLLMVLDNFEQIMLAVPQLNQFLEGCPGITLLVTCREPLYLAAEWRFDLEGLEYPDENTWQLEEELQFDEGEWKNFIPSEVGNGSERTSESYDSIQLFVQSARQAGVNFHLNQDNTPYVNQLCRMVMGTPLAIELAAYWLRAMPVSQIVEALSEDLDVLSSQMRHSNSRQSSMRAVLEYTWQQLSPIEQSAYQNLAVFRGGFDEDAARQVAQISPFVLLGLRDRGLLQYDARNRYALHELARQYAADKLANSGQIDAISRQHSIYYFNFLTSLTEDLYGEETVKAVETLKIELDNIRQAWFYALEHRDISRMLEVVDILASFYEFAGLLSEGSVRFRSAAESLGKDAQDGEHGILVCRLWFFSLLFVLNRYHFQDAEPIVMQLKHFSQVTTDAQTKMDSRLAQGIYQYFIGNLEPALELFNQVIDFYRMPGRERRLMDVLNFTGEVLARSHFTEEALGLHRQSLELARNLHDKRKHALALSFLGVDFWFKDDLGSSLQYFEQAVALFEEVNDLLGLARTLNNVGFLQNHFGDYSKALVNVNRSLNLMSRLGSRESESSARDTLGSVYFGMGDYEQAKREYYAALASIQRNGQRLEEVWALNNVGRIETVIGGLETAENLLQKALTIAQSFDATKEIAETLGNLGVLYRRKGENMKALAYLDHAVSGLTQMDGLYQACQFWLEKGELLLEQNDFEGAEHDLKQAIDFAIQRDRKTIATRARISLARLEIKRGNNRFAETQLRSLLGERLTQADIALIHDALWQATGDFNEAGEALSIYKSIVPRSPDDEYLRRIKAIEDAVGE